MEERRKTQSGKKTQSEQKTQNGRKTQNGYLTVYLSLCIGVILSLCLTLIEGARRNGTALEASCAAEAGMQSIFAEYHRQLLDQYNLFAVDSSYGSSRRGTLMSEAHLAYYLEKNVDLSQVFLSSLLYRDFFGLQVDGVEMTKVSFLTDGEGAVFRRRASEAVQDDIGLSYAADYQDVRELKKLGGRAGHLHSAGSPSAQAGGRRPTEQALRHNGYRRSGGRCAGAGEK